MNLGRRTPDHVVVVEAMQQLRDYLDEKNINWVDVSDYYPSSMQGFYICRTHFEYKGNLISVINGLGTYGGYMLGNEEKNQGGLEVMIGNLEPVGWLSCAQAIKLIFEE